MSEEEIPLVGGRSTTCVVRIGDTVHRPAGPWTKTVHAYLSHLHAKGFTGAPMPLGFDDSGREVLEYIPGDTLATPMDPGGPLVLVPYPEEWRSDDALEAAAALIRSLHEAAKGFVTENANWRLYDEAMRTGEIKEREADLPRFCHLEADAAAAFVEGLDQEIRWLAEHEAELGL